MFSLPFVLWTILMHPVSRTLISFPCCPQCDKNIKYLDINLTATSMLSYVTDIFFQYPLQDSKAKNSTDFTLFFYLNQKCKGFFNI